MKTENHKESKVNAKIPMKNSVSKRHDDLLTYDFDKEYNTILQATFSQRVH